jgi:hypothetical protein
MKMLWEKYSYTILLIGTSFLLTAVFASGMVEKHDYITVTVEEGESLWKIAEELSDEHSLTHYEFIAWVEKENGIKGGMIYAGEELVVPVLPLKNDTTTQVAGINIE